MLKQAAWLLGLAMMGASLPAEIKVIKGPAKAQIGDIAEIDIPKGWSFVPQESMKEFDEATQNLHSPDELGVLLAPKGTPGGFWAFFQFDDIGYIKDAAEEKLDADGMWKSMKDNDGDANAERKRLGYPEQELVAWVLKPSYNPGTQRLEWAYSFRSEGQETVNYNTRILGRHGVMKVTVVPFGSLEETLPAFGQSIAGFDFKDGNRYAQYVDGDKLAKAGLAALVLGGAAAAAASSGLLGKLWKAIVLGLIALAGVFKNLWARLTGRKAEPAAAEAGPAPKDEA